MFKAFFFDMDGVLFDSMPNHARAWEEVMARHHLSFTARDCYINEGRTGQDVIHEAILRTGRTDISDEEIMAVYREKTEAFARLGGARPMQGMPEVIAELQAMPDVQIWVVTGSGQQSLFDKLNTAFPQAFVRERMITAFDVTHGKPDPEPYLTAWERSGLEKEDCVVIENAPLGVKAGKAAGLFTVAVNTGPLSRQDLYAAGADIVLDDMAELLRFIQLHRYIETHILPCYDTFDPAHDIRHARAVIAESLVLCRELELAENHSAASPYPALSRHPENESKTNASPQGLRNLSKPSLRQPVSGSPIPDDGTASVNCLMCYCIAAYHDLGLRVNRAEHHLHSGTFLRQDEMLRQWFTPEEIETMAQAVEDHRASRNEPPRSLYGCIVAEADRMLEPLTVMRRTVQFGLKHYPELGDAEQIRRAIEHLQEKYSETGYLHLWLPSARHTKCLAELRSLMHDRPRLADTLSRLLQEERKN